MVESNSHESLQQLDTLGSRICVEDCAEDRAYN